MKIKTVGDLRKFLDHSFIPDETPIQHLGGRFRRHDTLELRLRIKGEYVTALDVDAYNQEEGLT